MIDDDDGNLSNGTPNYDQICEGASNHGFPCPAILVGVIISHTPLPSTLDHAILTWCRRNIVSTESTIDIAQMSYRMNGGAFTQVGMTNLRGGDTYTAEIPAQAQDGTSSTTSTRMTVPATSAEPGDGPGGVCTSSTWRP